MDYKYFAMPLWDLRPSEFEAEIGEIEEFEIDVDGQLVTIIAPKGYDLTDKDHARIDELLSEA